MGLGQAGASNISLLVTASGVLRVTVSSTNYDGSISLATNTVYLVEMACYLHASAGAFEVRINGAQVSGLVQSGIDTTTAATSLTQAIWNDPGNHITVGDCAVRFGVGTNGWDSDDFITSNGTPYFGAIWPDGDGFYTNWNNGGDYTAVDETICDTSDFISHNTGAGGGIQKQSMTFGATDATLDHAAVVIARGVVRAATDSNTVCDMGIRVSSTDYDHPDNDDGTDANDQCWLGVGAQADYECRMYTVSPATSAAFTKTDLDAIEVYFEQSTNANLDGGCVGVMDLFQAVVEYVWYAAVAPASSDFLWTLPQLGVGW